MSSPKQYARIMFLLAACITLVALASGTVAACDTCVAPDEETTDREPLWSNDDLPYDTDENTSLVGIVIEETTDELESDLGGENASVAASAEGSAANGTVEASADASAETEKKSASAGVSIDLGV